MRWWNDLNILAMPNLVPRFRISQEQVRLESRRPVRVQPDIRQVDYPPHDHEFAEISIVWSGRGWHRTREGLQPLQAGSMIVMMPGQVHAFEKTRGLISTNVYYLSEWLLGDLRGYADGGRLLPLFLFQSLFKRPAWQEVPLFQLSSEDQEASRRDLADLHRELSLPEPSAFYLRTTFLRFLYRSARAFGTSGSVADWAVPAEVQRLLDEVEVALAERRALSMEQAVRRAGLSRRHASRKFKEHIGMSLARYYQRRRIHVACALLLDPARSVTSVAYELGFADGAHFTRSFHAEMGVSPRGYQQTYRTA